MSQYARSPRWMPATCGHRALEPRPDERGHCGGSVMAKEHKNTTKTNKPKLTAKQKKEKRAEKRAGRRAKKAGR